VSFWERLDDDCLWVMVVGLDIKDRLDEDCLPGEMLCKDKFVWDEEGERLEEGE
jgi:hypothetical protein